MRHVGRHVASLYFLLVPSWITTSSQEPPSKLQLNVFPSSLSKAMSKNKFNMQMNELGLMWTIGVAGGGELVDDNDDEVDFTNLI
eukprot:11840344-Ditylum_brightwellii.AAC.1